MIGILLALVLRLVAATTAATLVVLGTLAAALTTLLEVGAAASARTATFSEVLPLPAAVTAVPNVIALALLELIGAAGGAERLRLVLVPVLVIAAVAIAFPVGGADLERVRFVDADFEEPDGTPAVLGADLMGVDKTTTSTHSAGPITALASGSSRIRVW